ncbi:hypothetical protein HBH53_013560 [Parastagonospora nodorum]|nr:hypothetical protein HBH53_013560 [Parastagonospora nodorum]
MHDAPSVYSQPHSSDLSDSSSTNFQPVKKLQTPTSSFHDGVVLAHGASASTHPTSYLSLDRLFTFQTNRSSSASTPSQEKLSSDQTTASTTGDSSLTKTPRQLEERSSPRSLLRPSPSTPYFSTHQQLSRSPANRSTSNFSQSRQQNTSRPPVSPLSPNYYSHQSSKRFFSPSTPNFGLLSSSASPSSPTLQPPQAQPESVSFASPSIPNLLVPRQQQTSSAFSSPTSPNFFSVQPPFGSRSTPNLRRNLDGKKSFTEKFKGGVKSLFRRDKHKSVSKTLIGSPQGFQHISSNSPISHRTVAGPEYEHSIQNQDMSSPTQQSGPSPNNESPVDEDMASHQQQFVSGSEADDSDYEEMPALGPMPGAKYEFAASVDQEMASRAEQSAPRMQNERSYGRDTAPRLEQSARRFLNETAVEQAMSPTHQHFAAIPKSDASVDTPPGVQQSRARFMNEATFEQDTSSPTQQSGARFNNEASIDQGMASTSQSPSSPPMEHHDDDSYDEDDIEYYITDEDAYEDDVRYDASISAPEDNSADAPSGDSGPLSQPDEPERYMSPAEKTARELGLEIDFSNLHIPTPAEREARHLGLLINFDDVMRMNRESSANDRTVRQYTDVPASYYAAQRDRPIYSGASISSAKSPATPTPKVIGQWCCCQCGHIQDLYLHDEGEHLVSTLLCACPHRSCENCSLYGSIKLYTPVHEPFAVQLSETDEKIKFGVFCSGCGLSWRAQPVKSAPTVMEKISAVGAAVKGAKSMHNLRGDSASLAKSSANLRQLSNEMEKEHGKQADSCLVFFSGIKCSCGNVLGTSCLGFQLVEEVEEEEEKVVKEAPTFASTPDDRAKGIGKEILTLLADTDSRVRHPNPLMGNPV